MPYLQQIRSKKIEGLEVPNYPYTIPAIAQLKEMKLNPKVNFFVGENGSGKSTLLEAIAVHQGFNSEGGTKNFQFETHPNISNLHQSIIISKGPLRATDGFFLRAESFYNLATYTEQIHLPKEGKPYHEQSHGEAFLDLILNKLRGNGLYLFDEPEAAISPTRQLAIMLAMKQLADKKSQFIVATHSPILLAYPGATIFEFSEHGIQKVSYSETEPYKFTSNFLQHYEAVVAATLSAP
jgi:predicted ATPase